MAPQSAATQKSESRRTFPCVWYSGHDLLLENIVRAETCHLYDADGKRYVDLESGVWCTAIGHANPRILAKIAAQSARIAHTGFSYSNGVVEAAARDMLDLFGFEGGKCVFLCSGSEAVEYGVRVAQMLSDRPLLMTMADSYFGAYGSASRKASDEWFRFDWAPCAACTHDRPCGPQCDHWAAIPFEDIGGFLFEPGSSSGLVHFPPEKIISGIVARIKEHDGLLLANEVTTGVGRTGKWFGYQHYDFSPDIIAVGKGIGNGYPVSVAAFAPTVIDRLGERPIAYAQSHQNDPLGAAVAREVVRVIKTDDLIPRSRAISRQLIAGLEGIGARAPRIKAIRGRGLMMALELADDAGAAFTIHVHRELVRRGYVVGRRPNVPVLRIDPPLVIGRSDIEGFLEALEAVVA